MSTTKSSALPKSSLCVVTGASRGIGAEFVRQLLARGSEVHAVTRNPDRLLELGKPAKGKLEVHSINLESKDGPAILAQRLEGRAVDLLVNNAGTYVDSEKSFAELDFDDLRQSFEVNTLIAGRVCQALLPLLKKSSQAKVAQITSLMGSIADNTSGGAYGYRISKAALNMLNRSFAIDHPFLTSIVLHPGWVKTDMGGAEAPTLPQESVSGLLQVIDRVTKKDSGKFFDFEGDELPW